MTSAHRGPASLLPPLAALVIALRWRRVIVALGIGALVAFLIHADYNPLTALVRLFEQGVVHQLAQPSHAALIVLILLIGGFVCLLERSGGMEAFARLVASRVRRPASAQLAVWVSGLAIFFSDSGTPLILGPTFRPLLERLGVSREKLAYIIDSTASPVCVLVPFISWGVYTMSLIEQSYRQLDVTTESAMEAFLRLLPLQFYPLLVLCAVPVIILSQRDLGPMAHTRPATQQTRGDPAVDAEPADRRSAPAHVILAPLLTLVLAACGLLGASLWASGGQVSGLRVQTSLFFAYALAIAVAVLVLRRAALMSTAEALEAFGCGVQRMLSVTLILALAWALGRGCQLLGTGRYLAGLARGNLSPALLPAGLFVIGAVISFSTGSSWGTFAILMPLSITVAHGMRVGPHPSMAAVLSGGLFGDHASPISDTTILASMGAGCEHIDHVRTQLPYALAAAAVSIGAFVAASQYDTPWLLPAALLTLAGLLLVALRLWGKPIAA